MARLEFHAKVVFLLHSATVRRVLLGLILAVLLWNGRQYRAGDGLDFGSHRDLVEYVSEHWSLPDRQVYRMAYNPPLFYFFCAAVKCGVEHSPLKSINHSKVTRIILTLFSFLIVCLSMQICGWILGEGAKTPFLLLLCAAPAFFRASAMYIPEQFLSLWVWLSLWIGLRSWVRKGVIGSWEAFFCALCLCGAIWTRPMGFAAVGAWGLAMGYVCLRKAGWRKAWLKPALIIGLAAGIGALSLFAFNLRRSNRAMPFLRGPFKEHVPLFKRQPLSFYFQPGLSAVFTHPIRPAAGNRLFPVLYSDYWGDYWAYWVANHKTDVDLRFWIKMLSAQNALAIIPTLILLSGYVALSWRSLRAESHSATACYLPISALALVGAGLFVYFAIAIPSRQTDQVKATYLCYLMPCLPMGGAFVLDALVKRPQTRWFWLAPYTCLFWAWSFFGFCVYPHNL